MHSPGINTQLASEQLHQQWYAHYTIGVIDNSWQSAEHSSAWQDLRQVPIW